MSLYVDNFINNTSHFQINDARQTPIIIPTSEQYEQFRKIFIAAQSLKKETFFDNSNEEYANKQLQLLQEQLENLVSELYSI